jgi:23S rRNA (cytosine1962-C5)-methyltransferase
LATKGRILLKPGKEKAVQNRHPWIYSGAVAETEGALSPGDIVDVYSVKGEFLARGYFNPNSQIRVRVLTHNPDEEIDRPFFERRIQEAFQIRTRLLPGQTTAFRVVNGEGDFLPGLMIDRYGDYFVLQITTLGMDRWRETIRDILVDLANPRAIYERSDSPVRRSEGLKSVRSFLHGSDIPDLVEIQECGARFWVDLMEGQKTGFYLDQRENRMQTQQIAKGREVLDCFCYTGAFSVYAARGGADSLVLIDTSRKALDLAEKNLSLNGLSLNHELCCENVFDFLRSDTRRYDLILLDPPPFVRGKGTLASASRGYKDINLAAFRRLRTNGLLFSFSCSHYMTMELFQKIVFAAALDSKRQVQIIGKAGHGVDHPVSVDHPEGEYLKGILCQVVD